MNSRTKKEGNPIMFIDGLGSGRIFGKIIRPFN